MTEQDFYENMTLKELKEIAVEKNVPGRTNKNQEALIELLKNFDKGIVKERKAVVKEVSVAPHS